MPGCWPGNPPPISGVTKSAQSVSLAVTSSVSLVPACGQNSLTPLLRLSPPRRARRGPLCENCVRSLCSAFPHATRSAGLARGPRLFLPKRLRPQARVVGQPPHKRRHLGRRQMGRARSKRKERCGGSGCASASLRPPAGDGWPFLVAAAMKRDALGESLRLGRARIPGSPCSAGATLAVAGALCRRRNKRAGADWFRLCSFSFIPQTAWRRGLPRPPRCGRAYTGMGRGCGRYCWTPADR